MPSDEVKLPNFFVVGAPKAGTTSLYHHLDQHPEIYMSPLKEPTYFSTEMRPERMTAEVRARKLDFYARTIAANNICCCSYGSQ